MKKYLIKAYCTSCQDTTTLKYIGRQFDQHNNFLFDYYDCLRCHSSHAFHKSKKFKDLTNKLEVKND